LERLYEEVRQEPEACMAFFGSIATQLARILLSSSSATADSLCLVAKMLDSPELRKLICQQATSKALTTFTLTLEGLSSAEAEADLSVRAMIWCLILSHQEEVTSNEARILQNLLPDVLAKTIQTVNIPCLSALLGLTVVLSCDLNASLVKQIGERLLTVAEGNRSLSVFCTPSTCSWPDLRGLPAIRGFFATAYLNSIVKDHQLAVLFCFALVDDLSLERWYLSKVRCRLRSGYL
jgi:hypothetical protein